MIYPGGDSAGGLQQGRRESGPERPEEHLRSPWKEGAVSPARVPTCMHTLTCTHTPAHMHRHIHTDMGATRRHMMQLPCLPPRRSHGYRHWSLTSTETQTHAYIRLFGVSCKRQERREFSRLVVSGRAPRLRCSCLPLLFSITSFFWDLSQQSLGGVCHLQAQTKAK